MRVTTVLPGHSPIDCMMASACAGSSAMALYQKHGVLAVAVPAAPPPPAPFKIFVLLAGVAGLPVLQFASVIVAARASSRSSGCWPTARPWRSCRRTAPSSGGPARGCGRRGSIRTGSSASGPASLPVVFEGGAIDVNGRGLLLATDTATSKAPGSHG